AVQIIKAGILEIADIFVVNKADLPGASKVVRDLKELVRHGAIRAGWSPPVLTTVAETGEGVDELVVAIDGHGDTIAESGELERRRVARLRAEVEAIVIERAAERARTALHEGTMSRELEGDLSQVDPYALAERILNGHRKETTDQ
ncbi:MAG: methylmalonyl Co-A mutase-associated GTPase MeaB, partial [Candidatus Dormiibacterota bacterium]